MDDIFNLLSALLANRNIRSVHFRSIVHRGAILEPLSNFASWTFYWLFRLCVCASIIVIDFRAHLLFDSVVVIVDLSLNRSNHFLELQSNEFSNMFRMRVAIIFAFCHNLLLFLRSHPQSRLPNWRAREFAHWKRDTGRVSRRGMFTLEKKCGACGDLWIFHMQCQLCLPVSPCRHSNRHLMQCECTVACLISRP